MVGLIMSIIIIKNVGVLKHPKFLTFKSPQKYIVNKIRRNFHHLYVYE